MTILSLVVPIYNVESYIIDCAESIFSQLPEEVQVIFINDGSQDKSIEYLMNYLSKITPKLKKNVILIHQENQGLSAARNLGIESSNGEYIAFLDSDDILLEGYFFKILNIIHNNYSIDMIKYNFDVLVDGKLLPVMKHLKHSGLIEIDNFFLIELVNDSSWYAWAHVYKRDIINKNKFPVGLNFEDAATIPYIYLELHQIYIIDESLYGYRQRENSITTSLAPSVIDKNINSLQKILLGYIDNFEKNDIFYIVYIYFIRVYFSFLIRHKSIAYCKKEWEFLSSKSGNMKGVDRIIFQSRKHNLYFNLYLLFGFYSNFFMNLIMIVYRRLNIKIKI